MKVKDLFELHQGNGFELMHINSSEKSDVNFVSRTSQNNGIVAQVDKIDSTEPFRAGYITVALGGSVLSSFVQLKPFYTAFHIMVLEPKKKMSLQEKLFYCMCIKANAYRFNYGRQANKTLKDIELPNVIPNWVYTTKSVPINTIIGKKQLAPLHIDNWEEFRIGDIFKTSTTKPLITTEKGSLPYVTRSGQNNGINDYVSDENYILNKGNCITIGAEGAVAFYQKFDFVAGVKVYTLRNKNLSKYSALFICTILNSYNYKYNYGRARILSKIEREIVRLPKTKNSSPDWDYMENYIKSLPYSDKI